MHGFAKKCGTSKPSFHVAFQHGSRIQVADVGNQCMFIVDGVILRLVTKCHYLVELLLSIPAVCGVHF